MNTLHRHLSHLLIAALSIPLFMSCMKNHPDAFDTSGIITIGYTIDGMQAGTYSIPAEGHELAVDDIHILFYESVENSGEGPGGYITYQHATLAHGTSTFSFPIPDALVAKTDYRTIIVGNAHSFVPAGYASFDAYLNACKSMTYDEAKQKIHAEIAGRSMSVLPMWGKFVDGTGTETPFRFESRTSANITGTIHLSRSVCRLDLKNNAANSLKIAWVKVCNYRSKGYYFHNDVSFGDIKPGLSSVPPSGVNDGYVRVAEPANGIQELKAGLYAFSNAVPIVVQNDDQTTYLMIAGYYQDGSGIENTTKLTYYRFNMAELGSSQLLKRNYMYRASIMSVKSAGADSEQGAKDESSPLLEYQVDDEWAEEDDDTVTDEFGNFLLLSRTQVTFAEGLKDQTEVIKVKVKEGMTWEVVPDHGTTDKPEAFSFTKASGTSFSITTLLDNPSMQAFSGRLKVIGTTPQNTKLELSVSLTQFSSADEMKILLVDGRNGTISKRVPGAGGTMSLLVQTGSNYAAWIAEDDGNSFRTWTGATFTGSGTDKGYLTITAPANTTSAERTATLLVHRDGVPDVIISLTQPKSDKLLTITPMPANGLLTVEGFDPTMGQVNGISYQKEFWVTLADPTQYYFSVDSDFDNARDLQLSITDPLAVSTSATHPQAASPNTVIGNNGQKFWINVFRTGPGDPTIRGTVTIKAVPKLSGLPTQTVAFNVNIVTSCTIGDAVVGSLVVADRNVGALGRIDETGGFVSALNFSNIQFMKITGYPIADLNNEQFRGNFYTYPVCAPAAFCPTEYADKNRDDEGRYSLYYKSADRQKWYTPTYDELILKIRPYLCYSKLRPFIVSKERTSTGKYIACFFPIAGTGSNPKATGGYYWSSKASGDPTAYYMALDGRSSSGGNSNQTSSHSIRCVRSL